MSKNLKYGVLAPMSRIRTQKGEYFSK